MQKINGVYEGYIDPDFFLSLKHAYMIALINLEGYDDAISVFLSINHELLTKKGEELWYKQSEIYEKASYAYQRKGNAFNAIIYKEASLSALIGSLELDNSIVQRKANELQMLLAENKKWDDLRKLEERFHLKPLPKQPGEK